MCSYFSMLENKTILIKHSVYILALQYVKAFPAGAVHASSPQDAKCISSRLINNGIIIMLKKVKQKKMMRDQGIGALHCHLSKHHSHAI